MPINILTQSNVKEKLKTLQVLLNLPRIYGPLLTLAGIVANQLLISAGVWPVQVAWLYILPAWAGFSGGLRSALASAALVSFYSIWLDPLDLQRAVIVPASVLVLAAMTGYQTRCLRREIAEKTAALESARRNQEKADLVDSANGNVNKLRVALKMLDDLLAGWTVLSDDARRNLVVETKAHLATLTTLVLGWRKLAEEKRYVEGKE